MMFTLEGGERHLLVQFAAPQRVLSWAIHNGGATTTTRVVWLHVRDDELSAEVDPHALVTRRLEAAGTLDAVTLLTSRRLGCHVRERVSLDGQVAECLATVGLGNALHIGDPPGVSRVGTINLLCALSIPLSPTAIVEALSLAAEARTVAIVEGDLPSTQSDARATGTGTDCIVVTCPLGDPVSPYAGKHTLAGHLVGASVLGAVRRGTAAWLKEMGSPLPGAR